MHEAWYFLDPLTDEVSGLSEFCMRNPLAYRLLSQMGGEYERTQEEEMELAFSEGRQPNCVYCEKPLDKIVQTQYENIKCEWNRELKKYVKQEYDADLSTLRHPVSILILCIDITLTSWAR